MQTSFQHRIDPEYFRYWGKASPKGEGARYHLLAFHSLDVAACGQELLKLPRFGLERMSAELGWSADLLRRVFAAFLAVHDIGKFARAFQGLAKDLGKPLVPPLAKFAYTRRHDTLGWLFLYKLLADHELPGLTQADISISFWKEMLRIVTGHHGRPPQETDGGHGTDVDGFFHAEDHAAGRQFVEEAFALLLPEGAPKVTRRQHNALKRLSWQLAGLAVLADWLGSDARPGHFDYCERPVPLDEYWHTTAVPKARKVIAAAGFAEQPIRPWSGPRGLFDFTAFTPLQQYAETVPLASGPQLFLLEDVTGAGKTEAALLLCHRLMAAGQASGLYFGLPTMATANQLYRRLGGRLVDGRWAEGVYRKLYAGGFPSLVLSHGARDLVEDFRQTVLLDGPLPPDRDYGTLAHDEQELSASKQCSAWLADSRKRALLADVGVGTIDQALLGVLPVRHQSLRLLGLANKVLIVDEVHAYDEYTGGLLKTLVRAQTMAGGSTILLSATVPATLRASLVDAFYKGLPPEGPDSYPDSYPDSCFDESPEPVPADARYPLATYVASDRQPRVASFGTRPDLLREVEIRFLHTSDAAMEAALEYAGQGRSVCWIRNTVEDARDAHRALAERMEAKGQPLDRLRLFHARFAMGHRLDIEKEVLRTFGKESTSEQRRGQILIATQVVEQSLDLDFDELLTDLAPIDLIIQRAGRLHRHLRLQDGTPCALNAESGGGRMDSARPAPVLHLLTPEFTATPPVQWYKAMFPRANSVYPDTGKLWLTLQALWEAGRIVSPGTPGKPGGVRALVEAVYGTHGEIPEALQRASREAKGKALADRSHGDLNALNLEGSYRDDQEKSWYSGAETPTRLGDENQTVYLACARNGVLAPLVPHSRFAWAMSAVGVRKGLLGELAPEWKARFGEQIEALRQQVPMLSDEHEPVLPLVAKGGHWFAQCVRQGRSQLVRYSEALGLETES